MNNSLLVGQLVRWFRGRGSLHRTTRAASAALSAVAVAAFAATAAVPAMASTAPSINTVGSDTNIAVQGPNHSLHFYWATNGVAGWHPEKVAGAGTAYSAPSMTNNANRVDIAVQGPATAWTSTGPSMASRAGILSRSRARAPPTRRRR